MACRITGREAIFAGLRKSIDGLDRRCSGRHLEFVDGPYVIEARDGHEVNIGWRVIYQYRDAPKVVLSVASVFNISNGVIIAIRDEYNESELDEVGAWLQAYGEDLDGSYV